MIAQVHSVRMRRAPRTTEQRERSRIGSIRAWQRRQAEAPSTEIRDGSIEAGLLCLKAWQVENPNIILSAREIAEVCGCSFQYIYALEQQALAKVRRAHCRLLTELKEAA